MKDQNIFYKIDELANILNLILSALSMKYRHKIQADNINKSFKFQQIPLSIESIFWTFDRIL